MKCFRLFVLAIAPLAFVACEQQPYSKLESMESIHHHHGDGHHGDAHGKGHGHGDKAGDHKAKH